MMKIMKKKNLKRIKYTDNNNMTKFLVNHYYFFYIFNIEVKYIFIIKKIYNLE